MTHTPGPWHCHKEDGDEWWFGGRGGGAQLVIRTSDDAPVAVMQASFDNDESEDDARLIAAAPDLLEVAREVVAALDSGYYDRAHNMAVKAIAKVTGKNDRHART